MASRRWAQPLLRLRRASRSAPCSRAEPRAVNEPTARPGTETISELGVGVPVVMSTNGRAISGVSALV